MLRFFQKMRNALVPESRFGRYFFYALGEILLVVIGILIAIRLNNWNEARKNHRMEITYMVNLKEDLQQDSLQLERLIKWNQMSVNSCNNLIETIRNHSTLNFYQFYSNMDYILPHITFIPNQNTFNEMKSSGNLNVIKNDSLKSLLIQLDVLYQLIKSSEQFLEREYFQYVFDKFHLYINNSDFIDLITFEKKTNYQVDSTMVKINRENLEKDMYLLMADKLFDNGLYALSHDKKGLINKYLFTLKNIHTLLYLLDKELKN